MSAILTEEYCPVFLAEIVKYYVEHGEVQVTNKSSKYQRFTMGTSLDSIISAIRPHLTILRMLYSVLCTVIQKSMEIALRAPICHTSQGRVVRLSLAGKRVMSYILSD